MKKAVRLFIKGRVQGVGYRWFAKETANQFNINGYVRNLPNGDVEVVAAGDEVDLDKFIIELNRGPGFAYVADMEIQELPFDEDRYHSFQVTF